MSPHSLNVIHCTKGWFIDRRENGLFHKCHLRPKVETGKDEILKVAQTFPKTGEVAGNCSVIYYYCNG